MIGLIKTNNDFAKLILVFITVIETFKNKIVIILNSVITSNKITNLITIGSLRRNMPLIINYGTGIEKAKQIVLDILVNDTRVLKDEESSQ